jgi:rhomboid protease GluP
VALFNRRTTGSVVCPACGALVGVKDPACYMCGRVNPGLFGFGPLLRKLGADFGFVPVVIGASGLLYVCSLLLSGSSIFQIGGLFSILSPNLPSLFLFGASGGIPVFRFGRWWTVLSASWLHGSLLHIVFNMYYVRMFGPAAAELFGPARAVIIYVISGAIGFLLSSLAFRYMPGIPILSGAGFTVGASAPLFGLLGAMVHYGRVGSSSVKNAALQYAVPLFLFGLIMPGVDNWAHAGGFLGGYLVSAVLNPMSRERGDHMIVALLCLLATFVAIVVSVLSGLSLFLK